MTLKDIYISTNPLLYFPLDEVSGTVATNYGSLTSADGTYNGVALAQVSAPGGTLAPGFDGTTDFCNIYSSAFSSAWDGQFKTTATIIAWWKVNGAGVWTDGTYREILRVAANAYNYYIILRRTPTNNTISCERVQPVAAITTTDYANTDWNMLTITWDSVANQYKAFMNDYVQFGTTQSASAMQPSLMSTACNIGSAESSGNESWYGSISHVGLWDRVLTQAEIHSIYTGIPIFNENPALLFGPSIQVM